jgi:predicted membrane-bound mannosyltransferase
MGTLFKSSVFTEFWYSGFLHHDITEILLKVALSTITLLVRHRDNYRQQFYHIYTVKPVLRGHIWDKGNVVL